MSYKVYNKDNRLTSLIISTIINILFIIFLKIIKLFSFKESIKGLLFIKSNNIRSNSKYHENINKLFINISVFIILFRVIKRKI